MPSCANQSILLENGRLSGIVEWFPLKKRASLPNNLVDYPPKIKKNDSGRYFQRSYYHSYLDAATAINLIKHIGEFLVRLDRVPDSMYNVNFIITLGSLNSRHHFVIRCDDLVARDVTSFNEHPVKELKSNFALKDGDCFNSIESLLDYYIANSIQLNNKDPSSVLRFPVKRTYSLLRDSEITLEKSLLNHTLLGSFCKAYLYYASSSSITTTNIENKANRVLKLNHEMANNTDFVKQIRKLGRIDNENVLRLRALCLSYGHTMLLFDDFAENLLVYLRRVNIEWRYPKNKKFFSTRVKLQMLQDVASGMRSLEKHGIVHGDVAARNCYVYRKNDIEVVKIAGANILTNIEESKLSISDWCEAIKWRAPECLDNNLDKDRRGLTKRNDRYAFGILLWEVFTEGMEFLSELRQRQYPCDKNLDIKLFQIFYRLLLTKERQQWREGLYFYGGRFMPHDCIDLLYDCTLKEPTDRPNYRIIKQKLRTVLKYGMWNC